MDNPVIKAARQAPPDWAKPVTPKDAPDPNMASPAQYNFINGLMEERDLSKLSDEQVAFLESDFAVNKGQASRIIELLLKQPRKPRERAISNTDPDLLALPAGRYAIENNQGELRFYKKWVSRDGKLHRIYVQHGPDESSMHLPTQIAIAKKILAAGIRQCAIRYGMEIGECSNCGRRLTNRISRELGIGPICGGRMFGDDGWKDEVKAARAAIVLRGDDPDEELE